METCPACDHELTTYTRVGAWVHDRAVLLRQRLGLRLLPPVCRQFDNINPAGQPENCRCEHAWHGR